MSLGLDIETTKKKSISLDVELKEKSLGLSLVLETTIEKSWYQS